jgi:ribonuclease HI
MRPPSASARCAAEREIDCNGIGDFGTTSSTVNEETTATSNAGYEPHSAGLSTNEVTSPISERAALTNVVEPAANTAAAASRYPTEPDDDARVELPSIPTVHCPPIRSSGAGPLHLRATQPHIKRMNSARCAPLTLPRTDTPMSLTSYPSNLSSSPQANSSASSSFAGISSLSKPGNPAEAPTGPKLSSPSTALAGVGGASAGGTGLNGRPAPPLLRSSLSTPTLNEEGNPSSVSSLTYRTNCNGPVISPQLRIGPTPPHIPSSTTSVTSGGATPLSSGRSSARLSFLRMVAPTSTTSPTQTLSALSVNPPLKEGGGAAPLPRNGSSSNISTSGAMRAVNGRVLASPHGARRPGLSGRRTTFDRTASVTSLTESPLSVFRKKGEGGEEVGSTFERDVTATLADRAEPVLTKEMRSFVLGQYRTLQREVLSLPTIAEKPAPAVAAAAPVQTDVSAADFVHIKKATCSRHSKAAKRAELKRQEEERLRALQQQHHDMEIIRNGGREQIGLNMKSSTVLAGSLSKLRSRQKSCLAASSMERACSSLDRTISAAFESEESPFASLEDAEVTALYGGSPFSSSSPKKVAPQPSESGAVKNNGAAGATTAASAGGEAEAWHSSKFFMAARTVSAAGGAATLSPDNRSRRTVNKNGMKGEAIVVAVVPDSDDDDSDDDSGRWSAHLTRTKGSTGRTLANGSAGFKDVAPPATAGDSAKRAGERLPSQQRRNSQTMQQQRGTPPSSSCLLHMTPRGDGSSDSSSDDDACFSFNKLRSQRLRSALSLSSTQPLDLKSSSSTQAPALSSPPTCAHSPDRVDQRHGRPVNTSKESSSDVSGDEGVDDDVCCFCCPCKRPENFFVLCRASSQSSSFVATHELNDAAGTHSGSVGALPRQTAAPVAASQQPGYKNEGNTGSDSRVEFEDLEGDNDDDEPLLSMQSFRRTSIQRVR